MTRRGVTTNRIIPPQAQRRIRRVKHLQTAVVFCALPSTLDRLLELPRAVAGATFRLQFFRNHLVRGGEAIEDEVEWIPRLHEDTSRTVKEEVAIARGEQVGVGETMIGGGEMEMYY